jgi:hypothetical protein
LYIPNTSARASFVLIVTVGSATPIRFFLLLIFFVDFKPSSLKSTWAEELEYGISDAGGGPHFFPRSPIERARASCMLYSMPSEKRRLILNLSFSGRFPGAGGAVMSAYREAAVEGVGIMFADGAGEDPEE